MFPWLSISYSFTYRRPFAPVLWNQQIALGRFYGKRKASCEDKEQSQATGNSVTKRRHEQILFRDFEKQLAED